MGMLALTAAMLVSLMGKLSGLFRRKITAGDKSISSLWVTFKTQNEK